MSLKRGIQSKKCVKGPGDNKKVRENFHCIQQTKFSVHVLAGSIRGNPRAEPVGTAGKAVGIRPNHKTKMPLSNFILCKFQDADYAYKELG